jgi:hypothetical protein
LALCCKQACDKRWRKSRFFWSIAAVAAAGTEAIGSTVSDTTTSLGGFVSTHNVGDDSANKLGRRGGRRGEELEAERRRFCPWFVDRVIFLDPKTSLVV